MVGKGGGGIGSKGQPRAVTAARKVAEGQSSSEIEVIFFKMFLCYTHSFKLVRVGVYHGWYISHVTIVRHPCVYNCSYILLDGHINA